jgi:multiple sugar transport system substrate-binding protein
MLKLLGMGAASTVVLAACGDTATSTPQAASTTGSATTAASGAATTAAAASGTTASTGAITAAPVIKAGTKITYWTWLASDTKDNPRATSQGQILNAFRKANPNIEVVEEVIPFQELKQQLLQATSAGKAPDVSRQVDQYIMTLAEADAILPLDEFTAGWDADRKNDYLYPWEDTAIDNKKFAFRQAIRPSNQFYYRTDLYKAAGFNGGPKTWDELTKASIATTKGQISGFSLPFSKSDGLAYLMQVLPPMLWGLGSDLVDLKTGNPTFQEDAGVKIMQWFQDMVYTNKVFTSGAVTLDAEANDQQFLAGVVAGVFANPAKWGQWSTRDAIKGKIATVPSPNFANDSSKPGSANNAGAWTLVMPKGANKDAAWKFMEFMQSNEAELIDAKVGGETPTRKSTLKDPFFDTPDAARIKDVTTWLAANPHEASTLKIKKIELLIDVLGDASQQIIGRKADVKQSLTEAAQKYKAGLNT